VKAIGNYRSLESIERRVGTVLSLHGTRANVRFLDGQIRAMPVDLFRAAGVREGEHFVLVMVFVGSRVKSARVERSDARTGAPVSAMAPRPTMPKIMVRDGLKVTTRR